jgi:hypothetical protein
MVRIPSYGMRAATIGAAFLLAALSPTRATAATLCVNPGGTGGCFASIQAAVDAAENNDLVQIAAGTYNESVSITGSTRGRLQLRGAGVTDTVIDAGGAPWGILVQSLVHLTVSDLTIQNAVHGFSAYRATLERCLIRQTTQAGIEQGFRSTLTVEDTTVDQSSLYGFDGYLVRRTRIFRSTFSNSGVGLRLGGPTIIEGSTISGNEIGLIVDVSGGAARVRRSTIANNSSSGCPAGVTNPFSDRLYLTASIIADNTCPGSFPDIDAAAFSSGYNLIEDGNGAEIEGRHDLDLVGADPVLGPLQDNGGPTATHEVLAGSPALGAVPLPGWCRPFPDQRGVVRDTPCDVGAFEAP